MHPRLFQVLAGMVGFGGGFAFATFIGCHGT